MPLLVLSDMGYIIGTDEAGYGPNLGPLLISATVWEAPNEINGAGLFDLLDGVVGKVSSKRGGGIPVFADSKILYTPGKGLRHLEYGLWAAWGLLEWDISSWRGVWEKLAPGSLSNIDSSTFYRDYDQNLPRDFNHQHDGFSPGSSWHEKFAQTGVKLLAIRSRAVFPEEFNCLMDKHESKGAALSHLTLSLVADLMAPLEKGPISVICDKHGGRDRYAALLTEHFFDGFVEVHGEGRQLSTYRFGPPDRRIEFQFRSKGENCLPAALASMASKYLRELAMEAFNAFWAARVPNLAPTAGYPQDALRFRAEIATKQRELGIPDNVLWRKK